MLSDVRSHGKSDVRRWSLLATLPLITGESLKNLIALHDQPQERCDHPTAEAGNPFGYGSIVFATSTEKFLNVEQKDVLTLGAANQGDLIQGLHVLTKCPTLEAPQKYQYQ